MPAHSWRVLVEPLSGGRHAVIAFSLDDLNNTVTRLATFSPVIIQTAPPATVTANPTTVAAGSSTMVSWSNVASPTSTDWIGLYPSNSTADTARIAYRYTGGGASGSLSFMVPATAAAGTTYEFRLFANNGVSRLGTSGPITITR